MPPFLRIRAGERVEEAPSLHISRRQLIYNVGADLSGTKLGPRMGVGLTA